jgi:hypothetical protein
MDVPFVDIIEVDGLDSAPFRQASRDHEGADGDFVDAEFESGRDIVLVGSIYADGDTMESYLDSLKANYAPSRTLVPFYVKAPGVAERVLFVKPMGCRYNWTQDRRTGTAPVQFLVHAEDPRLYTNVLNSIVMAAGSTITSGRGYNKSYNYGYGTIVTVPDSYSFVVGGNRPAPATITITGPCTNPQITNDTVGIALQFIITLGVSDVLVVDLLNHTVMLNGTVSRRGTLQLPNWYLLPVGNNIFHYRNASGSTSTATVAYRDAWR